MEKVKNYDIVSVMSQEEYSNYHGGTSCVLLWGNKCTFADQESVIDRLGNLQNNGPIFPTAVIQPLFVLAYEAALLAGHKIDESEDDAILLSRKRRERSLTKHGKTISVSSLRLVLVVVSTISQTLARRTL